MRKLLSALVLSLCFISTVIAKPVKAIPLKIDGDTVTIVKSLPFTVTATPGADVYVWRVPSGMEATNDRHVLTVTKASEGTYKIVVSSITWQIDFEKKTKKVIEDTGEIVVNIGKVVLPTPKPDDPPKPTPTPDSLPIKGEGLRMLIVEESGNRSKLPIGQQAIILGARVRNYLREKAAKDKDGEPEARIWDKDVSTERVEQHWKDAMKRQEEGVGTDKKGKRTALPWLMIANGRDGFEGELPKTVDEMLDLLKKYGG